MYRTIGLSSCRTVSGNNVTQTDTRFSTESGQPPRAGSRGRRLWQLVLLTAIVVLVGLTLHARLPAAAPIWATLRRADVGWLAVAATLEAASMAAFAEQQRRLLLGFGVRMSVLHSIAVTFARSAISISLPAGAAVSARYAFEQFRARGAGQSVAVTVTLLSGVASVAGLVALYAGQALASAVSSGGARAAMAGGAIITGLTVLLAWRTRRRPGPSTADPPLPGAPVSSDIPWRRPALAVRRVAALTRAVTARQWLTATGLALLNWLTDLACLLASLHAVGLMVPVLAIATSYLFVQLIRQIPATPGGVGIVEASLFIALTAAGAGQAPAAAAIIIYRVLSCWAILPIGLICWLASERR